MNKSESIGVWNGNALRQLAEQEVPADLDGWPAIRAQLPSQPTRRAAAPRLGWAFLVLGLLLVVGGATYALSSGVRGALGIYPGWQHALDRGLVTDLNLSQTVDGVTVTVEQAYADTNQVFVGINITGLGDSVVRFAETTLTDGRGTLPVYTGTGVAGRLEKLGVDLPKGEQAYIITFDSPALDAPPAQLDLRLVMNLSALTPQDQPPGANAEGPIPYIETPLSGAFAFDFSVPFINGRVMDSPQTAEAGGVVARLERVTVTPVETRATVCFDSLLDGSRSPEAILNAGAAGSFHADIALARQSAPPICYRLSFMSSLDQQQGEWTLTLSEFGSTDAWVFRFPAP